jgi:uncharacterized protein (DUF2249 family)
MAENAVDAVIISAPVIAPRFRHETIFGVLDALPVGYSALLLNDHDPKPLLYQLEAERPGVFRHEYVERGPERFAVRFTRDAAE